ncbi:hypothetical protein ACC713_36575, partial [Rhizobium johnstonii]|uniref:hypothetical protein n=1 Tax=Rhizobium johnstonii TaxID=3019933 RepID=UPI003F99C58B
MLTTEFNISLSRGLHSVVRVTEARELMERTIRNIDTNGDDLYIPELLGFSNVRRLHSFNKVIDNRLKQFPSGAMVSTFAHHACKV